MNRCQWGINEGIYVADQSKFNLHNHENGNFTKQN